MTVLYSGWGTDIGKLEASCISKFRNKYAGEIQNVLPGGEQVQEGPVFLYMLSNTLEGAVQIYKASRQRILKSQAQHPTLKTRRAEPMNLEYHR